MNHLLERRIAGLKGRALDAVCTGGNGKGRACGAHIHRVGGLGVELHAGKGGDIFFDIRNESAEFIRQHDAGAVGDRHFGSTGADGCLDGLIEEFSVRPRGVKCRKLHRFRVETAFLNRLFDEGEHRRRFLVTDIFHLYGGDGSHHVELRRMRVSDAVPGLFNISGRDRNRRREGTFDGRCYRLI